jgi:hypothetical protein
MPSDNIVAPFCCSTEACPVPQVALAEPKVELAENGLPHHLRKTLKRVLE